jgi:hypothetical protein
MTEPEATTPSPATVAAAHAKRTYTQADVDAQVREALREQREKHADYDQLKKQAEETDLARARAQELEEEISRTRLENLRVTIAINHGISPEDRDVLLTATDETGLTAQAERLAVLKPQRPAGELIAHREGSTTVTPSGDDEVRTFVRDLMGNDDWYMQ